MELAPSYIKNTKHFIQTVESTSIPATSTLVTVNMEALYTNILHEGIRIIMDCLLEHQNKMVLTFFSYWITGYFIGFPSPQIWTQFLLTNLLSCVLVSQVFYEQLWIGIYKHYFYYLDSSFMETYLFITAIQIIVNGAHKYWSI